MKAIDTTKADSYEIEGALEEGTTVTAHVEVEMVNYAVNPGFEDKNRSMWKVSYEGEADPTDYQVKRMMHIPVRPHFTSGPGIRIWSFPLSRK